MRRTATSRLKPVRVKGGFGPRSCRNTSYCSADTARGRAPQEGARPFLFLFGSAQTSGFPPLISKFFRNFFSHLVFSSKSGTAFAEVRHVADFFAKSDVTPFISIGKCLVSMQLPVS